MDVSENKREEWIDFAKALGMLLVYIGHTEIPDTIKNRIYMFHMPLFFIISGFLWNEKKYKGVKFRDFIKKKIQLYIVPYMKIALVCFLLWDIVINFFTVPFDLYIDTLIEHLKGIFIYSIGSAQYLPHCSPIWFLTCLFVTEILYYWIMRFYYPEILVVICFVVAVFLNGIYKFPWNVDTAITAIPFLYIGTILRRRNSIPSISINWFHTGVFIVASAICLFLYNWHTSFAGNHYDHIIVMYLFATIVSITTMVLSYQICCVTWLNKTNKLIVRYVGMETIFLMGYNYTINPIAKILSLGFEPIKGVIGLVTNSIVVFLLQRKPKIKKFFV